MKVWVRLYASLRRFKPELAHGEATEIELEDGATLRTLLDTLGIPATEAKQSFVNGVIQRGEPALKEGDEVGIFPPIAGG